MDFKNKILHSAVRMQLPSAVESLVIAGAEIEACLQDKTSLIFSVERGDYAMVEVLIERKADITTRDDDRRTALHKAVWNGHERVVELLVEKVVQLLLEKGADISLSSTVFNATDPSLTRRRDQLVQLLVKEGADISTRDSERWTVLRLAYHLTKNDTISY